MNLRRALALLGAVALGAQCSMLYAQSTQPIYTLHDFKGSDGSGPVAPLLQMPDGNLYGTASGGANRSGTVYKLAPNGAFTTLHNFAAVVDHTGGGIADPTQTNADGAGPGSLAKGLDGAFYGATGGGGLNGRGTIFRIDTAGGFTVLHTFSAFTIKSIAVPGGSSFELINADGASPTGLTRGTDGNFYGVTAAGGANGNGTVYRITPAGALTTLHDFSEFHWNQANPVAQQTDLTNPDGATPYTQLVLGADGSFYGVAAWGGPLGTGVIFKITPAGALTALRSYGGGYVLNAVGHPGQGVPAIEPITLSLRSDGSFYGTSAGHAVETGIGAPPPVPGTLFTMTPSGAMTIVHTFTPPIDRINADGATPQAALLQSFNGHTYGTTTAGGDSGLGTIFDLGPNGQLTTLYNFVGGDGAEPEAQLLLASDGNLYGTAATQGPHGNGVVFEVSPNPPAFLLHDFDGTDGTVPLSLLQAKDGEFYGVTYNSVIGGVFSVGGGVIFRAHVAGDIASVTTLHVFGYQRPNTGLIQAKDGMLYGTTLQGGSDNLINGSGNTYRMTTAGDFAILHAFTNDPIEPSTPYAGLIQLSDGNFYGTSGTGGQNSNGTVYRMTPGGAITILHSFFENGFEGYLPESPLFLASDGNLYGTTGRGGIDSNSAGGAVFRITLAGALTTLHRFDRNKETINSVSGLVEGSDGDLYGVNAGIFGNGHMYKVAKNADAILNTGMTVLHVVNNRLDEGNNPSAALLAASDGNFYGTLYRGASSGTGAIYRLASDGTFAIVHRFHGPDGADPFQAQLVEASDGNIYGVAGGGGKYGYGTLFRLAAARPKSGVTVATDVTGQVQIFKSGFKYVNATKRFVQSVTIVNTSATPISGPVSLVLDSLTGGVTLFNKTGATLAVAPAGSSYINAPAGGILPGQSATITLEFTNLGNKGVLYAPRVLAGTGSR